MKTKQFKVSSRRHCLKFKFDAGTSRGVLKIKETFYIIIRRGNHIAGLGEAAPLKGLSVDDRPDFESLIQHYCKKVEKDLTEEKPVDTILSEIEDSLPALKFGFEMALRDFQYGGERMLFSSAYTEGKKPIPINGLIWMNNKENMLEQVRQKVAAGFRCIKMKIGAINFEEECAVLSYIREHYNAAQIMLRVDANGAFNPFQVMEKLERLSEYQLHSIEQPIPVGNIAKMRQLSEESPIPIALDEELIGIFSPPEKEALLEKIRPPFIILKPTLLGGFKATDEWINIAEKLEIGWWVTSALESNIGLNAVAQYTAQLPYQGYQGLGTGQLFHNNIPAPMEIIGGSLFYYKDAPWDLNLLEPWNMH